MNISEQGLSTGHVVRRGPGSSQQPEVQGILLLLQVRRRRLRKSLGPAQPHSRDRAEVSGPVQTCLPSMSLLSPPQQANPGKLTLQEEKAQQGGRTPERVLPAQLESPL